VQKPLAPPTLGCLFSVALGCAAGCGDSATPSSETPGSVTTGTSGSGASPSGAAGQRATTPAAGRGTTPAAGSSSSPIAGRTGSSTAGTSSSAAGTSSPPPTGPTGEAGSSAGDSGSGGSPSTGGAGSSGGSGEAGASAGSGGGAAASEHFSFFVTSLAAMRRLSGSDSGFGGDLRFGKPDGLSGADEICRQIAETAMPGAGNKPWRAFLSVTKGPDGQPVNAIDRVGEGPWYDRLGRLVAMNKADLAQVRPKGADPAIINDLPNEDGVPNHAPDGTEKVDNHDILTGSSATGTLYRNDWSVTCHDWTSAVGSDGKPRVGHSWPRNAGGGRSGGGGPGGLDNWMSALDEAGCAPGVSIIEMGPPNPNNPTVGSGGGYGGIYCFSLTP